MLIFNRHTILPILLVIPMVSHWIFPAGIETRCYIHIFGISFYLPNILYLIYIFNYNKLGISLPKLKQTAVYLKNISAILFIYSYISISLVYKSDFKDILNILFNDLTIIYFPLLFFCYPLDRKHLDKTKYLIIPSLIILCLEVYLYSLGIMKYQGDGGSVLGTHEYAGVTRISTTVGAATGTGVIILIIGIISISFYKIRQWFKLSLVVLTTVSIFFTVSRGAVISWSIYLCLLFYINYFKKFVLYKRILSLICIFSFVFIMNRYGVFQPIQERNTIMMHDDVTSGRSSKYAQAEKLLLESNFLGCGPAMVFAEKSIQEDVKIQNKNAMHNLWLVYITEYGIPGFLLIVLIYAVLLKSINFKSVSGLMVCVILIINANTEAVLILSEFMAPFLLLILMSNKFIYGKSSLRSVS